VVALEVAAQIAPPKCTIYLDNLAVVKKVNATSPALLSYEQIDNIRIFMSEKHLSIKWVKGHNTCIPNQMADFVAKQAIDYKPPMVSPIEQEGVFQAQGEKLLHIKPIIRTAVKTHSHEGIHGLSWVVKDKKFFMSNLHNWSFGIKVQPGFDKPSVSWTCDPLKFHLCNLCSQPHDCSVYGTLGICSEWQVHRDGINNAWGTLLQEVSAWLSTQGWKNKQIYWRFLMPTNLHKILLKKHKPWVIKRHYIKFSKQGSCFVKTLKDEDTPMDVEEFRPVDKLNAFEWPEDSEDLNCAAQNTMTAVVPAGCLASELN